MYLELLKDLIITAALQLILCIVQMGAQCPYNHCLTGGFFFAPGRHMVDNHALLGHVFDHWTVTEPVECFRKCRCDCRCISFNYLTNVTENNCQLNDENRHTSSSGLKSLQGSQYYDLVINYDIRANFPHTECQNGCCGSHVCLNGGICHQTCDVTGKRFRCSCKPHFTGRFCETAICPTADWLLFNYSCFKAFTEEINWFKAQQNCRVLNSNLTSIHSSEENDFVRYQVAAFAENVWIGLTNLENMKAVYEWVDESNVSFTNWVPGEPNNLSGSENCTNLNITSGQWNDLNCGLHNRSYVCGRPWYP